MKKNVIVMALMASGLLGSPASASAQQTEMQNPAIPLSSEVRHGTLENGLNYYILHNEEPKNRVNFYIAQKVGSTLETQEQLGLAHFLEHMAFNGTKHYPGKNMLNYLQSKGIRFGADINAYTGFDETVYNINNVPANDQALMDSVLLVLSDWSGSILLEEDEINAERGVIEEEWRSRSGAQSRMLDAILPIIYQEYQYQQTPIGKMEVVRNFKPQVLRDYYHKWYRPDQQGIIIVGDMDAEAMEKKVIELFSKIPAAVDPAPRTYPTVSDNDKPIFAQFADKEMPYAMIQVSFKSDQIPTEVRNTAMAYVQENIVQELISKMINNRLQEYAKDPKCHYAYASTNFGDFLVSKTKATFDAMIIVKDDVRAAYNDAMSIVARACKTGFLPGEMTRARSELLAEYEKAYNERKSTKNDDLARKIIRTFIDNKAFPGAEKEYQIMQQMLPMLPIAEINNACTGLLTPNNQVIIVSLPEKEGMEMMSEEVMTGDLAKILSAEYTPYVDEELPSTLISKAPKAGKITKTQAGKFETTEFTLSNGAKVVVKPTDFQNDEILFQAFRKGGRTSYSEAQAAEVVYTSDAVEASKLGQYKRSTVEKYLAGKKVKLEYDMGNVTTGLDGSSTVKDLENLMELVYMTFTDLQPDADAAKADIDQTISILETQSNNPNYIFQTKLNAAMNGNKSLFLYSPTLDMMKSLDYQKSLAIAKESMANAADYTFIFVGNVNINALKPMLEKYIASLPSKKKASKVSEVTPLPEIKGIVTDAFDVPMAEPSTNVVLLNTGNNVPFSIENAMNVQAIGDVLSIIYTETLREEEGGTYSPFADSNLNPWTNTWRVLTLFQTNSNVQAKLIERSKAEINSLATNGVKPEHFSKVKEAMAKQYEINVRTNKYWKKNLKEYLSGYDVISGHKAAIDNMSVAGFNQFVKNLNINGNRLDFIMTGVKAK